MLPTDNTSSLVLSDKGNLQFIKDNSFENINNHFKGVSQHLHFTCHKKIIEGWIIGLDNKPYYVKEAGTYEVIEATTDSSLKQREYDEYNSCCHTKEACHCNLPKIPQSYIQKYAESNGTLKEVWVEMEMIVPNTGIHCTHHYTEIIWEIKTNSNNEVIIHLEESNIDKIVDLFLHNHQDSAILRTDLYEEIKRIIDEKDKVFIEKFTNDIIFPSEENITEQIKLRNLDKSTTEFFKKGITYAKEFVHSITTIHKD